MNPLVKMLNDITTYGLEKVGLFYSSYRGYVYDREDPEGYGRLMVSVPEVFGDMVSNTWAWPASNYSGKGYGAQVIPQRNDLVWITFEKGNPRKPLWSYGYFGKGDKPDELKDLNNYWFKTPGGHLVELDDTNGIIKVTSSGDIQILKDGVDIQPAALGTKTTEKIQELIDLLVKAKVNTSLGPQPLFNILADLTTLKGEIPEIESTTVKISE